MLKCLLALCLLIAPTMSAQQPDDLCPARRLAPDKGVLSGRAIESANEHGIEGAQVVVSWSELVVDKSTLRMERVERAATVGTRTNGEFHLCGVPTETRLTLQLEHGERASSAIGVMVPRDGGVLVQNLSLGTGAAGAAVTGIVRGAGGSPLAGVDVRVRDANGSATTDSAGRFVLTGLADGTQVLMTRRIGYALGEFAIELRAGRRITHDVQLERAVTIAPIVVNEYRSRFKEFEFNRGIHIMAEFLTADMIAKRDAEEVGELVDRIPGFVVVGHGAIATVFTNKALQQGTGCPANVVVDGVQEMGVNDVRPEQVVGIEAYVAEPKPSPYRPGHCGLVVIWTTNWRRPVKTTATPPGVP